MLDKPEFSARLWRPLADRTYSTVQVFLNQVAENETVSEESFLQTALPPNVQIMTLQALSSKSILLRLSHQFGLDEDTTMSKPATVNLAALLSPTSFQIAGVEEVSLTNVKTKEALLKARQRNAAWPVEGGRATTHPWRRADLSGKASNSSIVLGPLEIKTYVLTLA